MYMSFIDLWCYSVYLNCDPIARFVLLLDSFIYMLIIMDVLLSSLVNEKLFLDIEICMYLSIYQLWCRTAIPLVLTDSWCCSATQFCEQWSDRIISNIKNIVILLMITLTLSKELPKVYFSPEVEKALKILVAFTL